jgi:hypothetical protein
MCDKKTLAKNDFPQMCDGKGGELRMGKKIIFLSGITLFALTLTFAGCSKKEEPAPPPPPPPAPAPAAPAPTEPLATTGDMKSPADTGGPMEKKSETK